ncbi:MAG: hypothetical protein HQ582_10590 [Planctomycetes bacterium]|nr:hypothetical protein [Planctomycetota bacterium]
MDRIRAFAWKTLVWLAAVLVPLQALPSFECCCAAVSRQQIDAENQQGRPSSEQACCCGARSAPDGRAPTHSQARPRPCCRGDSTDCTCAEDDSAPLPSQAPPESRLPSDDPLAQPLVDIGLAFDPPPQRPSDERLIVVTSAPERCILLCSFRL